MRPSKFFVTPVVLFAVFSCSEGISNPSDTTKRDDGAVQLIIKLSGSLQNPAYSPDGQWIVFSSENDHVQYSNIYKSPSHGGAPIRLTTFDGYDGAPSISPDGKSIVFESTDGDPEGSKGTAIWMKGIQ